LNVDPATARITAVSDPLPQIVQGIPLRLRSILVTLDRQGFTFNPTNCNPFSVGAVITGSEGAVSNTEKPFQVANCANLAYAPKLTLKLTGGLRRRGHPAIHAVLKTSSGEANSRRVSVTLPRGELLDNKHIRGICTRVAFARDACPPGSKIGRGRVVSPLLDEPLSGSVYLRSSRHDLPDLALDLEGQVDIEVSARIDSVDARLRATFENLPDAPVGTVTIDLAGGRKGLLQNTESLCGTEKKATVRMTAQNDAELNRRVKLQAACGSKGRRR
jgi:hypothetical protein